MSISYYFIYWFEHFFSINSIFSFLKILVPFFYVYRSLFDVNRTSTFFLYSFFSSCVSSWSYCFNRLIVIWFNEDSYRYIHWCSHVYNVFQALVSRYIGSYPKQQQKNVFLIIISIKLKSLLYDSLSKANLNCYVAIVSSSNKRHPKCVHMYICICMNDLCSCVSAFFFIFWDAIWLLFLLEYFVCSLTYIIV